MEKKSKISCFLLLFVAVVFNSYGAVGDVYDLGDALWASVEEIPAANPYTDPNGAEWSFWHEAALYPDPVLGPNARGWAFIPAEPWIPIWEYLLVFTQNDDLTLNFQPGDIGGYAPIGMNWQTLSGGTFKFEISGYSARTTKLGSSFNLTMDIEGQGTIYNIGFTDSEYPDSDNALIPDPYIATLDPNTTVTVTVMGADWAGLTFKATQINPPGQTYHVDGTTGSNSNDGLSRETAFGMIQYAIDMAQDTDTILVWPGVYNETATNGINFMGKAITVKSAADAAVLEVPGYTAVTFAMGEDENSVLSNFVIRGSSTGIFALFSDPTVDHVTVVNNDNGVMADNANPVITNSIFWGNANGDLFGIPDPITTQYSFIQDEVDDRLVAYWKLDGNAVDFAGGYNGTIYGATTTAGQVGDALNFDGQDDYVALPDNEPVWLPQNNFTLSVWVYFAGDFTSPEKILDLNHDDSSISSNELGCFIGREGSKFNFWMTTATNPDEDLNSNQELVGNKWYHLVAIRNGTTQSMYIDGEFEKSRTCSADPIDFVGGYDDDKVNIGMSTHNNVGIQYFDGLIDEVAIYDRAVSDLEIEGMYQAGLAGHSFIQGDFIDELAVAHWQFNGDATDSSDNGYDGTVHGTPNWIAEGVQGEAIQLDPNDYIEIEGYKGITGSASRTCSAWIKIDEDYLDRGMLLTWGELDTGKKWVVRVGTYWSEPLESKLELGVDGGMARGSTLLNDGNWHHVAVVLQDDGSVNLNEIQLYVDGEQENTIIDTFGEPSPDINTGSENDVLIGRQFVDDNPNYFDGLLDDIRIYDIALSGAEIKVMYETGLAGYSYASPGFVDPGNDDYHLLSERGRYRATTNEWILDDVTSSCVDAGNPNLAPTQERMPNGGRINMGAYGETNYASMSEWPLRADIDYSGGVNLSDFAAFADDWLEGLPWVE